MGKPHQTDDQRLLFSSAKLSFVTTSTRPAAPSIKFRRVTIRFAILYRNYFSVDNRDGEIYHGRLMLDEEIARWQ
jgi:hypothetical protein